MLVQTHELVSLIDADMVCFHPILTHLRARISPSRHNYQLVSGISWILIEESAEGSAVRSTWTSIGLMIDLICCVAVLFPVVCGPRVQFLQIPGVPDTHVVACMLCA